MKGEDGKEVKENKTEELVLTIKLEEQIAIQTLVTPLVYVSPLTSQYIIRPSIDATPLQISRPSLITSKHVEDTSYGYVILDDVIELPKFGLTTITIEKMSIIQGLHKNEQQELLRRELK